MTVDAPSTHKATSKTAAKVDEIAEALAVYTVVYNKYSVTLPRKGGSCGLNAENAFARKYINISR